MARPRTVDPSTLDKKARLIGSRIRAARTRAGLTQSELARRCNVTQGRVSAYEVGRNQPSNTTLDRISAETGAPVAFLLGDERWDHLVETLEPDVDGAPTHADA